MSDFAKPTGWMGACLPRLSGPDGHVISDESERNTLGTVEHYKGRSTSTTPPSAGRVNAKSTLLALPSGPQNDFRPV